jgi:radical SAM family RiPP maturation amino acid epimerase
VFREHCERIPQSTLRHWGIDFDHSFLETVGTGKTPEEMLREYWNSVRLSRCGRSRQASIGCGNEQYRSWRSRQIGRFMTQSDQCQWRQAPHAPFAIELSRGCSVGCGFCGFAAPRLQGIARFSEDIELLFTSVLKVLGDFVGMDLERGMLYWATEPLDNPDYEKFLQIYHRMFGVTPQTTTAAWSRNPARTRKLLANNRKGCSIGDRFSINSLNELSLCMTEFSPDEIEDVSLVFQNAESLSRRVTSGRGASAGEEAVVGTIACVTGFLVNLLDRSVRVITPSTDLKQWPLGYEVHREGQFEDARELSGFLDWCAQDLMRCELNDETVLRLRCDLKADLSQQAQVVMSTSFCELTFDEPSERAILRAIDGQRTTGQIVHDLMGEHGAARLYYDLRQLHDGGLFEQ